MLLVNGVSIKDPSEMTWGLQDISDSQSGRTQDALMWKNRVAQKRKLSCSWYGLRPAEASALLQAVNPEYMEITYFDAMGGSNQTRTFYIGDRSAPVK